MSKTKALIMSTAAACVAGALLLTAIPANASPAVKSTSKVATTRYSDLDVVDFLLFGRGPIAVAEPGVLTRFGITPVPNAPASAVSGALSQLQAVDPHFHANVTVLLQEHDPYAAQKGLANFTADLKTLVSKAKASGVSSAVASPDGENAVYTTNYYVVDNDIAQSFTAVTSFILAAEATAVWLTFYQHTTDGSAFDAQNAAQALAGL